MSIEKKILVVDDSVTVRTLVSKMLQKAGYSVEAAADGVEALEKYQHQTINPDLIILDIEMPRMNGLEFLYSLRKIDQNIPIIIVSSRGSDRHKHIAFNLGVNEYFTKPCVEKDLLDTVHTYLSLTEDDLEKNKLRRISILLSEENETLKDKIKQLEKKGSVSISDVEERFEAICGSVAHRLKNEFLNISSSIEEIRDLSLENGFSEIDEECKIIERSIEYSQQMIYKLLNYLEMGYLKLEKVNIVALLEKVCNLISPRIPSGIKLSLKNQKTKKCFIQTNADQLTGIIIELIQNSINAMYGQKDGLITIEIIETDELKENCIITLSDNGPGIPADLKDKLLREQVKSKRGLGLGLYLCRKVLINMGGDLQLVSSEDGSKFMIFLPTNNIGVK
jgi:CheY-like chemotaxis protein/two-component sensor histidine kinase